MYSNKTAIDIENLSKMYKIYNNKRDKVLDLLNLKFGFNKKSYDEFWALKDINLQIPKGTKLGILGRNGAGKSTLLKIITGNIKPTTGKVSVSGKVSALLELGTGFHPEFTGKENIFASLAYMGLSRKEAKDKYLEIVDFSELEDFIDKPVKTYSAGMYTRLAFSVATSIIPEILIIDEILGAGDAYFINKSIERMKNLTDGGTTVLFVSHDIASVQKMCNDAIWIDKGKIVMQGDIIDVSKSYLASIREQEELRLRAKNMKVKQKELKTLYMEDQNSIIGHLVTDTGKPIDKHPINTLALYRNDKKIDELTLGDAMDNDPNRRIFIMDNKDTINWSKAQKLDGKYIRNFEDVGGIYNHAVFVAKIPKEDYELEEIEYEFEIKYKDVSSEKLYIELYDQEKYVRIGEFQNENDGKWKISKFSVPKSIYCIKEKDFSENVSEITDDMKDNENIEYPEIMERERNDIYGSGEVKINTVKFLDEDYKSKYVYTSREKMIGRIYFNASGKVANPIFVIAIYGMDGTCITQQISKKDNFNISTIDGKGYVDIIFDPLLIGRGEYKVSAAIFKDLNLYDQNEPEAYDLHDRVYEIKVEQPFGINTELGLINHPVRWGIKYEK